MRVETVVLAVGINYSGPIINYPRVVTVMV